MKVSPLICITTAIFIIAFFLISPFYLQSRGMWYVDDDYTYFAHSSAIVFGQFPSYKKEFLSKEGGPEKPIGAGILAAPFVFAFSLLDRAAGSTITETRTEDNIVGSWSQFGFQAASVFYLVLACYFLYFGISRFVGTGQSARAVILMMVCQGLPLYVYRRPFFSHCSEAFIQCVLMYFFLAHMAQIFKPGPDKKENKKSSSSKLLTGVFALSGLLYLTRPNDIAFALVWPLLMMDYSKGMMHVLRQSRIGAVLFAGIILVFKIWPEAVNHTSPYSWAGEYLGTPMTFADIIHRIVHIFVGTDWGLIFTAPFLILSFGGMFLLGSPILKRFVWLLLPMAINFYVIIAWGSQGGWYGYRYFIISAIPVMTLPLAFALEWISKRIRLWVIPLIILLSLAPVFSMVAFERHSFFNQQVLPVDFNRTDWTNPDLQVNIWMALIHAPGMFCYIISHGFMSLILSVTGEYPPLTGLSWLRIFIVLFIPWLTWLATRKFFYNRQEL